MTSATPVFAIPPRRNSTAAVSTIRRRVRAGSSLDFLMGSSASAGGARRVAGAGGAWEGVSSPLPGDIASTAVSSALPRPESYRPRRCRQGGSGGWPPRTGAGRGIQSGEAQALCAARLCRIHAAACACSQSRAQKCCGAGRVIGLMTDGVSGEKACRDVSPSDPAAQPSACAPAHGEACGSADVGASTRPG